MVCPSDYLIARLALTIVRSSRPQVGLGDARVGGTGLACLLPHIVLVAVSLTCGAHNTRARRSLANESFVTFALSCVTLYLAGVIGALRDIHRDQNALGNIHAALTVGGPVLRTVYAG